MLDYLQARWDAAGVPGLCHMVRAHQYICGRGHEEGRREPEPERLIGSLSMLLSSYPAAAALVVYCHDPLEQRLQLLGVLQRDAASGSEVLLCHLQPLGSLHGLRLHGKRRQLRTLPPPELLHLGAQQSLQLDPAVSVDWRWKLLALLSPLQASSSRHQELMALTQRRIAAAGLRRYLEDPGFADLERQAHLRCRLLAASEARFRERFLNGEALLCLYKLSELFPTEAGLEEILGAEGLLPEPIRLLPELKTESELASYVNLHHSLKLPRPSHSYSVPLALGVDFLGACPFCRDCGGLTPSEGRLQVSYLELPYVVARLLRSRLQQALERHSLRDAEASLQRIRRGEVPSRLEPRLGQKAAWGDQAARSRLQKRRHDFRAWDALAGRRLGWLGLGCKGHALESAHLLDLHSWRQEQSSAAACSTGGGEAQNPNPQKALQHALDYFPACVSRLLTGGQHLKFPARRYLAHYLSKLKWPEASKRSLWYNAFLEAGDTEQSEADFMQTHPQGLYYREYSRNAEQREWAPPSCERAAADGLCPFSSSRPQRGALQELFQEGLRPELDIEELLEGFQQQQGHRLAQSICAQYLQTRRTHCGFCAVHISGPLHYYEGALRNQRRGLNT